MTETMFLGLVLVVFVGFGSVLAWVDYTGKDSSPPISGPQK
ncbi:hypothetical protein ACJ4V0_04445 [Phreatobacter sp. HK31-P]|nr:hypothetical protein [Phreatobacter sp.]